MIKLASNLQNLVKRSAKASPMSDYAMYGGAGVLGGSAIGALINHLRDKSVAEGALVGGGIGGAAGLGTRGIMDLLAEEPRLISDVNPGRRTLDQLRSPGGMVGAMAGNVYQGALGHRQQMLNNERDELAYIASLQAQQAQNEFEQPGNRLLQGGEGMSAQEKLKALPAAQQLLEAITKDEQELEAAKRQQRDADFDRSYTSVEDVRSRRAAERNKGASARNKRAASSAGDYAMYGGAGALGGAGLGALINYLRDQSVAQGALVGGGLGGAAGLGTRGVMDLLAKGAPAAAEEGTVPPLPRRAQSQRELNEMAELETVLPTLEPGSQEAKQVAARLMHLKTSPTITPKELAEKEQLEQLLKVMDPGPEANAVHSGIVGINVGR